MAKFIRPIGFAKTVETEPGVWEEVITERSYTGELVRSKSRFKTSNTVNSNVEIDTEISIVADQFAIENFQSMVYIEYMGTKWRIETADPKVPRIILTIGGVFNESQTETPQ